MASHGPLKKPTMVAMPVLLFLADHPELLMVHCGLMNGHETHFSYGNGSRYRWKGDDLDRNHDEDREPEPYWDNEPAPEVLGSMATYRWLQSGWTKQIKKKCGLDDKGNPDNHWAWYDRPERLTKAGSEVANQYRTEYDQYREKQKVKQKEIERLVIVKDDDGYNHDRKYGFLARVVKETKTRLYVEHVHTDDDPKRRRFQYFPSLHGRRGHEYVERTDVTVDGVTTDQYSVYRKAETSHLEWLTGLEAQEKAELDEIRERYSERREQNKYAFEDELREALDRVKNNGT